MRRLVPLATLLAFALVLMALPADAQKRYSRRQPELTTEGRFEGTWTYTSVARKFAFFIKFEEGVPRLKVQWMTQTGEGFHTDWEGKARYLHRGFPITIEFDLNREASTRDRIVGTYTRQIELEEGDYRRDVGTFEIFRSFSAQSLAWRFINLTRESRLAGKVESKEIQNLFYTMIKVSERVVEWEVIPW
jgi:hypothetical protein